MTKTNLIITAFLLCFPNLLNAAPPARDSSHHASISIDLLSSYYTFFDSRRQYRGGIDYQRLLSRKVFAALALDAGVYNKYRFVKYYNYFTTQGDLYDIEQRVNIYGFHLQPSLNYYLLRSARKPHQGVFTGGLGDFSYYRKSLTETDSRNGHKSHMKYDQWRMCAGMALGFKVAFSRRINMEMRSAFLIRLLNENSRGGKAIRALNVHWSDRNDRFGWLTQLKVAYVF